MDTLGGGVRAGEAGSRCRGWLRRPWIWEIALVDCGGEAVGGCDATDFGGAGEVVGDDKDGFQRLAAIFAAY